MTDERNADGQAADGQGPDDAHVVPEGVSEATVEALGTLSAALEVLEHARGLLYGFHRLTGTADLNLGEAVEQLRKAGHTELAERIDTELVGRNVIDGGGRSRSSRTTTTTTTPSPRSSSRPPATSSSAASATCTRRA